MMKVRDRKACETIIDRANKLMQEAEDYGFNRWKPASEQPIGTYDLWAMASKARQNADTALSFETTGFVEDAQYYLREAEDSYKKVQQYNRKV